MHAPRHHSPATFPNITQALLAGLIGGLVGTAVKTVCELIAPPRAPGVESPLGNVLNAASMVVTGHEMPDAVKTFAEPATHFIFGILAGGAYAVAVAKWPIVRAGYGTAFAFGFWLLVHEIGLPLMGFSPSPAQMSLWEQGNELVTHLCFGVALEFTRRAMIGAQAPIHRHA